MNGPVTFATVTVPVVNGEARIPGRYPHDFASIPLEWTTVRSLSKYVLFPALPPGDAGQMSYWGSELDGDAHVILGERRVYGWTGRRSPRWRIVLGTLRYRLGHALAALRGSSSECDE